MSLKLSASLIFASFVLLVVLWASGAASILFSGGCFIAILLFFILFRNSRYFMMAVVVTNVLVLTVVISDVCLRFFLPNYLYYRPHERFIRQWPLRPYLVRYLRNIDYSGTTYGDLAAFSGNTEIRQVRDIAFKTDEFGFRNDPQHESSPYDVIVIGDSFGVGNGTTQDAIWTAVLAKKSGLKLYNLSMAPGNPWRHYLNLNFELPRISVRPGSLVLLAMFSGNDLDEFYGNPKTVDTLPQNGWLKRSRLSFNSFRRRSPLNRLQQKLKPLIGYENNLIPDRSAEVRIMPFGEAARMAFYTPYVESARRTQTDIRQHAHFTRLQETLHAFKNFCERNSLLLKVVLFPSKAEVYSWVLEQTDPRTMQYRQTPLSAVMASLCADENITYLDLFPVLADSAREIFLRSGDSIWWLDDTHINVRGHAIAGDAINCSFFMNDEVETSGPVSIRKAPHDMQSQI